LFELESVSLPIHFPEATPLGQIAELKKIYQLSYLKAQR